MSMDAKRAKEQSCDFIRCLRTACGFAEGGDTLSSSAHGDGTRGYIHSSGASECPIGALCATLGLGGRAPLCLGPVAGNRTSGE